MVDVARLLTDFSLHGPFALELIDHDLRFLFVNDAMAAISRYPAEDHVGRRAWEIVSDEVMRAVAEPLLNQVLTAGKPFYGAHLSWSRVSCSISRWA